MATNEKLGARLQKAIDDSQYNAKQVAQKMGISPQSLSRSIKNNAMREDKIRKFAEVCDIEAEYLLYGTPKEVIKNDDSITEDWDFDVLSKCISTIKRVAKEEGLEKMGETKLNRAALELYALYMKE